MTMPKAWTCNGTVIVWQSQVHNSSIYLMLTAPAKWWIRSELCRRPSRSPRPGSRRGQRYSRRSGSRVDNLPLQDKTVEIRLDFFAFRVEVHSTLSSSTLRQPELLRWAGSSVLSAWHSPPERYSNISHSPTMSEWLEKEWKEKLKNYNLFHLHWQATVIFHF